MPVHRRIGFMRPDWAYAFVFVTNMSRGVEHSLQPMRPKHRRWPPEFVYVANRLWNFYPPFGTDRLTMKGHWQEWTGRIGIDRFFGCWMQHRRQADGHIWVDVVPGFGDIAFIKHKLELFTHRILLSRPSPGRRNVRRSCTA